MSGCSNAGSSRPGALSPVTAPSDQPLATRLAAALGDAYTIEGEVGRGGMGVVYRARDERLQRRVAIKVLPPELAFQPDIRERFTREAQTAAKLSHPHIVPIHTVGEGHGLVYFVMGYVDGESVAGRIRRRGKLPVEEVRRIMAESADALGAAHALSIIHRDIKPDNILLEGTRGRVMVTDFGIAKALSGSSGATLTGAGVAIGTPAFMSPEQAAGEREIDGRSDLYSLGVVTYQMLTGGAALQRAHRRRHPHEADHGARAGRPRQAVRRAGGPGARREPLPGEGSGEPLAHRRRAAPGAGEPGRGGLSADRARLAGRARGAPAPGARDGAPAAPPRGATAGTVAAQSPARAARPRRERRPRWAGWTATSAPSLAGGARLAGPPATGGARGRHPRYRRAEDRAAGPRAVRQLGGGLARLLRDQRRHRTRHAVVPLPDLRHGHRDAEELRHGSGSRATAGATCSAGRPRPTRSRR